MIRNFTPYQIYLVFQRTMTDFKKGRPDHTREELNDAAEAARAGDEKAKTALGEMMQPIVIGYLKTIGGNYSRGQRDEMTQAAWLGVWDALGKWENDGRKFSGWAYFYMKTEVSKWLAENTGVIPLPRQAWWNARTIENAVINASNGETMPYELGDEELAIIARGLPSRRGAATAGDTFRARRDAYVVDSDFEPRGAQAAEDDHFDEEHGVDADAFDALDAIRTLVEEDDEQGAWTVAIGFIDKHRLPVAVAERMMEAVT